MKKLLILSAVFCICFQFSHAQEKRYLVFEFIRVDKGKTVDYLEYKDFLSKVYAEAVKKGDIVGWDLWSLKSGSELDSYQYATVTYFKDPVNMMNRISEMLEENGTERYNNFVKTNGRLMQRISLGDLAGYLGITQVSLSRIRARK